MHPPTRRLLSLVLTAVMLVASAAPASAARATTLAGIVTDMDSGAPIGGAVIRRPVPEARARSPPPLTPAGATA